MSNRRDVILKVDRYSLRRDWILSYWRRVDKSGDCWNWLGQKSQKGYGRFLVPGTDGKRIQAHRIAVRLDGRELPQNMVVDHLCKNKSCVNPSHLDVTTAGTNTLRGDSFSAVNKRKTSCIRGHSLAEGNYYLYKRYRKNWIGFERLCKKCAAIRKGIWKKKARRNKSKR